jgi:hypothetical protein
MALRIMRLSEVKAVTGLSKTTIYRFEKKGDFRLGSVSAKGAWVGLKMIFRAFFSHLGEAQTLRLAIEERNREIWLVVRG